MDAMLLGLVVLLIREVHPLGMWQDGSSRIARLRKDPDSGEVLIPALGKDGIEWLSAQAWAKKKDKFRLDPGSLGSCTGWAVTGSETEKIIYEKDGVRVTESEAMDALGGTWRCLRTSDNYRVVQSALRVVDGSIHAGALAGYTRTLAAAALLVSPRNDKTPKKILNLGLGAGSVPNFLCAHLPHANVLAIELSEAVLHAAQSTARPEPGYVDVVLADGVAYTAEHMNTTSFDVAVIDIFDMQSKPPSCLASPAFAQNIANLVSSSSSSSKSGGVAINLVTVTALADTSAGLICAEAAVNFIQAFARYGKRAFLTIDPDTENAVLWCLSVPRYLNSQLAVNYLTRITAPKLAHDLGIQFDLRAQLAPTIEVTVDNVRAALSASSSSIV